MKHITNPSFWKSYYQLPISIQNLADKNFALLKENPWHPSLHLKKVKQYWSVRISKKYRSLAIEYEKRVIWFWIGSHGDYEKLIRDG
jgi:hypothetical protein